MKQVVVDELIKYIVNEEAGYCKNKLNSIYESISNKYSCYFISNVNLTTGIDGVHLDKVSHEKLADKLFKVIKENIINENS